jgi:hypothetical protein
VRYKSTKRDEKFTAFIVIYLKGDLSEKVYRNATAELVSNPSPSSNQVAYSGVEIITFLASNQRNPYQQPK